MVVDNVLMVDDVLVIVVDDVLVVPLVNLLEVPIQQLGKVTQPTSDPPGKLRQRHFVAVRVFDHTSTPTYVA